MFRNLLVNILIYLKFNKKKFKYVGKKCSYKYLTSDFPNSEKIVFGNNVFIGPNSHLDGAGGITIGNGVIMAPNVTIYSRSHNFSENLQALPFDQVMHCAEVKIGDYVWIGSHVIILPGVEIGKRCVIGAGSVVSKNIPDYGVAVGNPAKVVKYRDSERFEALARETEPFVYEKLGHKKIFKHKS